MTDGYSGTPLWKKLGLKPDTAACVIDPPQGYFVDLLEGAPTVTWGPLRPELSLIHIFSTQQSSLADHLRGALPMIRSDGRIWISWPKKASKVPTDLIEDRLRDIALPMGIVDIKVCAIDAIWSGLCFVIRKELRALT